MSRHLLKFFALFLPVVILPLVYNEYARKVLNTESVSEGIVERLEQNPPPLLAIGTSRMGAGLHPQAFDKELLIMMTPFMDLRMMKALVEAYENELRQVDKVILEYHPEMMIMDTLSEQPEIAQALKEWGVIMLPESWNKENLASVLSLGTLLPDLTRLRLNPRDFLSRLEHEGSSSGYPKEIEHLKATGFRPLQNLPAQNELFRIAERQFKRQRSRVKSEMVETGMKRMIQFLDDLRESGISYCWLEMPNRPEVTRLQRTSWKSEMQFYQKHIAPKACIDREFVDEISYRLKFSDPVHLYIESAFTFSEQLSDKMN